MSKIIRCPITNIPVKDYNPSLPGKPGLALYQVEIKGKILTFTVEYGATFGEWEKDGWFVRNKHLIASGLLNGLPLFEWEEPLTVAFMKQRILSSVIPHTPKQKLDGLLKFIADQLKSPGESFGIYFPHSSVMEYVEVFNEILQKTYLFDRKELEFYVETLQSEGLVRLVRTHDSLMVNLTYQGLSYLASLEDEGALSKNCFVAMAFSEERSEYRLAIINAIEQCGYVPVIIDDRNIDSDKTINDQIIAEIRKCKFCISDFTLQRNGVYFEAGFALGLGKPVIYVCDKEDFKQSHFDLKPFQHILYDSAQKLQTGLVNKIGAWIQ